MGMQNQKSILFWDPFKKKLGPQIIVVDFNSYLWFFPFWSDPK